ncbi:MAG: SprT family zinc-dependent metalloprotease [Prevotellaceae bacterium]|uniref:M48 family metallopeptidase n=1 Tax=Prevotella sp. AGR2160 TaxID=1280674 RepID=UPI000426E56C|nr:SprT family zinc-dependent metalloprotease [Prevotella sp. AGR2160]MDD5861007.1 SprT family zinc-dependent metalloprotease [Prevotella sp.]MDD6553036.1 SprT family zinc-dependent metalloprotease [Prevotellaceae bacterium]
MVKTTRSITLNIDETAVAVDFKPIKNIHLTVYPPDGRVHVSAPDTMDDESVKLFVISRIGWIHAKQREISEQPRQSDREYVSGEDHYFLGARYRLLVETHCMPPHVAVKNKQFILMTVKPGTTKAQRQTLMNDWYRAELAKVLGPMIEQWTTTMNTTYYDWQIQDMQTRWGSCNYRTKRLLFNLQLAKKPRTCIEYVVVHELIHTKVRLHNDTFWALMDRYLPDWRTRKDRLDSEPLLVKNLDK